MFWATLFFYIKLLLTTLILYICLLMQIAAFTLVERKTMAAIQRRVGPNVVGLGGIGQPFADGLKLALKETVLPSQSNRFLFLSAPLLTFLLALTTWAILPLHQIGALANPNTGALLVFAISSLGIYGVVLGGWSSNSTYAFMGAIRSTAQMIAYEVTLGFTLMPVFLTAGSANLHTLGSFPRWMIFSTLPAAVLFFISLVAETNRAPFDLPEAEAELVAGFNVEYSALVFALFFLGEYANIITVCAVYALLYLGGWTLPFTVSLFTVSTLSFATLCQTTLFSLKVLFLLHVFVWIRATFPRFRFDQLMQLCWVDFLALSFTFLLFHSTLHLMCL